MSFSQRYFAVANADYQTVDSENWYTPERKHTSGRITVFNGETTKETKNYPWELKELAFKNGLGCIGVYGTTFLVD